MQTKQVQGSTFYTDEQTQQLSQKYDISAYKGSHQTLGEAATEEIIGRFLDLAKMCGEVVGVDYVTYKKQFSCDQGFSGANMIYSEDMLIKYSLLAHKKIGEPAVRIEQVDDKKVFVPSESLVKVMLKGSVFIPLPIHHDHLRRRN